MRGLRFATISFAFYLISVGALHPFNRYPLIGRTLITTLISNNNGSDISNNFIGDGTTIVDEPEKYTVESTIDHNATLDENNSAYTSLEQDLETNETTQSSLPEPTDVDSAILSTDNSIEITPISPPQTIETPPVSIAPAATSGLPYLLEKYKGKVILCCSDKYPHCEFILCGSIHVAKTSQDMVQEVIEELKPQFVMLELCEARVDILVENPSSSSQNVTLQLICTEAYHAKSLRVFAMGLFSWMQAKAAKVIGSPLGGEQSKAAKIGAQNNAMLVLGDRLYSITIQRMFDRLSLFAKIKVLFIFIFEILTMSVLKLKEYIKKSEDDSTFVEKELEKFAKYLPELSDTIINERDEYMAQTLCEVARVGFGPGPHHSKGRVVAVVGAGHLPGLQRCIMNGGISEERLFNISTSSKQKESCWPGKGSLHIVNTQGLYAASNSAMSN
eukprot:gene1953-3791_t